PRETPSHPCPIGLELLERCDRLADEGDVVAVQVGDDAVEMVGDERAAGATGVLLVDAEAEAEHEVVDEKLRAAAEEVGERLRPRNRLELVLLLDRHPGQFPAPAGELIALPHVLLLGVEQLLAGRQPLLSRSHRVFGHRGPPFSSAGCHTIVSLMANDTFTALAHPVRRAIVARLSGGAATVGEASRGPRGSQPTITRHLKLLWDARVVTRVIDGRTRRLGPPAARPR